MRRHIGHVVAAAVVIVAAVAVVIVAAAAGTALVHCLCYWTGFHWTSVVETVAAWL